jgi:hydroxyethylthiazole kinase-like uncharacterized protein yjeF
MKTITPALLRRWPLPDLDPRKGKVSRGKLLVAGGSDRMAGAVILAGLAGLRAGAGTLQIATTRSAAAHVPSAIVEAFVTPLPSTARRGELGPAAIAAITREAHDADAVVLGPGSQTTGLSRAARGDATWVLDAGAIHGCRRTSATAAKLVLTPHVGEMASLCDVETRAIERAPVEHARAKANELDAIIVLKGHITYVVAPDGEVLRNIAGNHGLGTSGSGDVLAGVIGGLAARGATPMQAAAWGVHLHALAGEVLRKTIGPLGYLAHELLDVIPRQLARLDRHR